MNIINIVKVGLEQSGYDGLFIGGICACQKDDLSPGGCLTDRCEVGYIHRHSINPDLWAISPAKGGIKDSDIEEIIAECT
jgi:hypothetical protein